ncbi:MAG TPA: DUF3302 domain-containing protein [Acetobacteraceae bacterium]|nr:DUF3302 domain-containing protein [Acetobacteraceae bacterium]
MESTLGFKLDGWDFATFAALFVVGAGFVTMLILVLGLPGQIAIARKHPEAEAVNMMGWLGFIAIVPWVQAFIWAFKPTDVADIRYLPRDTRRETDEEIARLTGKAPPADAEERPPPADPPHG